MSVDVVVLQGGGAGAHREDAVLAQSLREHRGDGYAVAFPRMPKEDDPDFGHWQPAIAKALEGAEVLVGHSLGGYFALKHLAETRPVFLYASPDDEVVPFAHRDLYHAAIPGSVVRSTAGGHQLGGDLRVVAEDIHGLFH